jgi:catechol 2,3-dioxygenase-like lactoylglutathione lyase family enzyme
MFSMPFVHFTLPTSQVERTARFFENTLGFPRNPVPANSPMEIVWLDIGRGQEIHLLYVERFEASRFEGEFGRHVAVSYPAAQFGALKHRLIEEGAELIEPGRATPFERFFFREPVNGYVFEVIDASHFDQ